MSSQKTINYNLHKWIGTDYVKRIEFNENFDKIDTELKNNANSISNHSNNKSNPHGVTKAQVGLSNVTNDKQATKAEFDGHINDKLNPHNVTKSQVGLSNVQNYSVASQAEAEAGASTTRYMTPFLVKQAITSLQAVKSVNGKTGSVTVTKSDVGLSNVDNTKQASKAEFDSHTGNKSNPHGVTKGQVGLGNVDNVKQASKSEFDSHTGNKSNPHGVTKSQVGLGNVTNDRQATKSEFDSHNKDYTRHGGYAVATTTDHKVFNVSLNPAPTAYVDGMVVTFKVGDYAWSNMELNVNGLGAKPIVRYAKAGEVAKGVSDLGKDNIYTVIYNSHRNSFVIQNSWEMLAEEILIDDPQGYYKNSHLQGALQEIGQAFAGTRSSLVASAQSLLNM